MEHYFENMKKKKTWMWCKIIRKINVEQTKNNMRRIAFIYTLLKTQFKEKYLEVFQSISN